MKKIILSLIVLLSITSVNGQIKFEEGNFAQVLEKAQNENKLIFIDCYTAWCGPCKQLAKIVFPNQQVGEYMNSNFINYKSDMEKGEGIELRKRYEVTAFPTLLILTNKGEVLNKVVGMNADPDYFLNKIKELSDPKNSIEYRKKEYLSDFNKANDYLSVLKKASMESELSDALTEVFNKREPKDRYSDTNFEIYQSAIQYLDDPNAILLLKDSSNFIKYKGEESYLQFIDALAINTTMALYMNNMKGVNLEACKELEEKLKDYHQLNKSQTYNYFLESYKYACNRDVAKFLDVCLKYYNKLEGGKKESIKRFAYRISFTSGEKAKFDNLF